MYLLYPHNHIIHMHPTLCCCSPFYHTCLLAAIISPRLTHDVDTILGKTSHPHTIAIPTHTIVLIASHLFSTSLLVSHTVAYHKLCIKSFHHTPQCQIFLRCIDAFSKFCTYSEIIISLTLTFIPYTN